MGEMKTIYGQLYNYGFDRESARYNWVAVDDVLFGGGKTYRSGSGGVELTAIKMVQDQFELPLQCIWRVHVLKDGMVELNDFTLPSSQDKMRETFRQEDLPVWIQDSLSVLMIVDQGVTVEGVGRKINDSIFYLMETPEIGEVYGNKT
jgi:hypothetical protein